MSILCNYMETQIFPSEGVFDESYLLKDEVLGEGKFAIVYKAQHKRDKSYVAVKIVKKKKLPNEVKHSLRKETEILQQLNHPHILKLVDVYEDPEDCYLVTELMKGGDLYNNIASKHHYSESGVKSICKKLFRAISYCHECKIAHRDLKPENILLADPNDDTNVKIADFGFAKYSANNYSLSTQLGTHGYAAPEIVKGQRYGTKVDMWSLGVIMYILLCGDHPFAAEDKAKTSTMVRKGIVRYDSVHWDKLSNEATSLVRNLLKFDPSKRFSAENALNSNWIQNQRRTQ